MPRKIKVVKKKVTEPDEFISTSSVFVDYIKSNYTTIGIVFGVVLLVALIAFGWFYHRKGKEKEALVLFNQAKQTFQQITAAGDQSRDVGYRLALQKFEKVSSNYAGTKCAVLSLLYLGDCSYRLKEYDKAIEYYLSFIDKTKRGYYLRYFAFEGLGYCFEEKGDFEKAIDYYNQSLKISDIALQDLVYLNIARCYEALNDKKNALAYYKKVGNGQDDSVFFKLAKEKIMTMQNS